jgi:ATP-dependent DNA ligase
MPAVKTTLLPMEALLVDALPAGKEWRYEPKWDGFRCLAYKRGKKISLKSKSGKPLDRYFPDIVALLQQLPASSFVLDGELLIMRDGGYSFGDLQLRLHPAASRVAKLVAEAPATFVVFDLLENEAGENLTGRPLADRRAQLEKFHEKHGGKDKNFLLSPQAGSLKKAQGWLKMKDWRIDGIVAKNVDDAYAPGERVMQKYKVIRTADCVVGGFRYGTGSKEVASLLLGLYDDDGLLNHVGFTSSIPKGERKELTKRLEKLIAHPGFTGKAPGGPSRWSTDRSADWQPLKPELVVEVAFDQVTDDRFRHGTKLVRYRPDKSPKQCKMEQIA